MCTLIHGRHIIYKTVGHVPDLLAHALAPQISGGNTVSIEAIVTGELTSAPEGK